MKFEVQPWVLDYIWERGIGGLFRGDRIALVPATKGKICGKPLLMTTYEWECTPNRRILILHDARDLDLGLTSKLPDELWLMTAERPMAIMRFDPYVDRRFEGNNTLAMRADIISISAG